MELVITLGTGVGCAVFFDGALLPHMELSHGRFGDGLSIEVGCGDHERQEGRQGEVARAGAERAGRLRGDGAARPSLHRRRQRQAARPGRPRSEPHDRAEHLRAARRHRAVGTHQRRRTWTTSRHPFWAETGQDVAVPSIDATDVTPDITATPEWSALPSTTRPSPGGTCASCSPRTRAAPRRSPPPAPTSCWTTPSTASPATRSPLLTALARRGRAGRAHRGDVRRARTSTPARTARCCTPRCAPRGRARWRWTARTWSPRCTRCSTGWASSPTRCVPGPGPGTPASGSGPWSTSASAAPTSGR